MTMTYIGSMVAMLGCRSAFPRPCSAADEGAPRRCIAIQIRTNAALLAAMATLALPAQAACLEDAERVRQQYAAVHAKLSVEDHNKAEDALGKAYSLCSAGQESDAAAKLSEASAILSNYATAQPAASN